MIMTQEASLLEETESLKPLESKPLDLSEGGYLFGRSDRSQDSAFKSIENCYTQNPLQVFLNE